MLWAFLLGYAFFGELPNTYIFVGALIVVASGLFVLWRERYLRIERVRTSAVEGPPVGE
jgi:drug/metabolite transporter (DMT)-like permease